MTEDQAAGEIARLRLELEHRDQLLASVHARADTLRASVERLERQLDAAAEEQREAATERAELRRLLGNAQLPVHALMQLPAPNAGTGVPADGGGGEPDTPPRPAAAAPSAEARAPRPAAAAPSAEARAPRPAGARPQAPPRRRSLLDDARGLLSGLRRMI